jgi:hypothetical protein
MTIKHSEPGLSIGWDVGGWNCDKNRFSRDALVTLDLERRIVGKPWRGSLRQSINAADKPSEFLSSLLGLCGVEPTNIDRTIVLAVDAPLGFPQALMSLLTHGVPAGAIDQSSTNPYLYRHTEQRLFLEGISPLSTVKDMIGSQSTKAIHAVVKFAPISLSTGVWSDGKSFRVIETYPAACHHRLGPVWFKKLVTGSGALDIADAHICALVAHRFLTAPDTLEPPTTQAPSSEGWIWLPIKRAENSR